ncbi:ONECUT1 [Lepeophtheirus salmonis]|uniref:ONECUT1 n=1 Tax=Lepeophtheirus salmonis TaxID=72036 RepID=A0A7R8CI55_LEPSM|nr:ONECUT1 [Lepeophtheirus salmonis]CAF2828630.1 ONECUT1 [Lepeophtheirus salmonis]
MQVTIARQLGLDPSTVSNFFMNARRRSVDKWKDENIHHGSPLSPDSPPSNHHQQQYHHHSHMQQQHNNNCGGGSANSTPSSSSSSNNNNNNTTVTLTRYPSENKVLMSTPTGPAAVVQHLHTPEDHLGLKPMFAAPAVHKQQEILQILEEEEEDDDTERKRAYDGDHGKLAKINKNLSYSNNNSRHSYNNISKSKFGRSRNNIPRNNKESRRC